MHLKACFLNLKPKALLLLMLLLALCRLWAQNTYTVFKTTGQVLQYSAGKWTALKAKDQISAETAIKCDVNASFIVFDAQYKVYDVKKSGEFKLKNGLLIQSSSNNEELQKAVKFFVQQTFSSGSQNVSQKSKGSVERGKKGSIFPWDSTLFVRDTVTFKIQLPKTDYPVQVQIRNGPKVTKFLAYHDTTLRIPSADFENAVWNLFKAGKQQVAFTVDKGSALANQYLKAVQDGTANALQYYLALEYCHTQKLYEEAGILLKDAHRLSADELGKLKELLKDGPFSEML